MAVSLYMPPENESRLAESVEDLNQEVRVLREAVDELRETLQWISQNKGAQQTYSVLKAVARDVNAPDWHDHLQVKTGVSAIVDQRTRQPRTLDVIRALVAELLTSVELSEAPSPRTRDVLADLVKHLEIELPQTERSTVSEAPRGDSLF